MSSERTVKFLALLLMPLTVTTTAPESAAAGTSTRRVRSSTRWGAATWAPPKVTSRLSPVEAPKFAPVRVTMLPGPPFGWLMLAISGVVTERARFGACVVCSEATPTLGWLPRPRPALLPTRSKVPTGTLERV
ncbi:hypothetical protein D3C86_969100 [compost metagenome]